MVVEWEHFEENGRKFARTMQPNGLYLNVDTSNAQKMDALLDLAEHTLRASREDGSRQRELGDLVEAALTKVGITEKRVTKVLGRPCGCGRRKTGLNRASRRAKKLVREAFTKAKLAMEGLFKGEEQQPEPVDVVYPLSNCSKWNNNELRYSLRSLEKYAKNLGRVFIVTDNLPSWLQGVVHVPVGDKKRNADANIIDKLRAAIHAGVSERFIFASDDQYLTTPTDLLTLPVSYGAMQGSDKTKWRRRLKRTFDRLKELGKPTVFYDTHLFQPHLASQFEKAVAEEDYNTNPGYTVNTLAFNKYDPPVESVPSGTVRGKHCRNHNAHDLPEDVKAKLSLDLTKPSRFESDLSDPTARGIVILAGGPVYFINAYINCRLLRLHGCTLPIEWFYLGDEMPEEWKDAVLRDIPNIQLIDLGGSGDKTKYRGGWQAKVEAIMASSFLEILFLDADSFPRRDPTDLFEHPFYRQHDIVLWPDIHTFDPKRRRAIRKAFGVQIQKRQVESGQMMFRKPNCIPALLKIQDLNRDSERTYKLVYGDKDTFMIGALQAGANIGLVPHANTRLKKTGLVQKDFNGNAVFTHLTNSKWTPGKPSRITEAHFPQLQETHGFYREALLIANNCEGTKTMQFLDEQARGEAIRILCNDMYEIKPMVGNRVPVKYIVDIGANMGAFTLHAALTYPDAEILSVEADPEHMELAKANTTGCAASIHYVNKACVGLNMPKTVRFRRFRNGTCGGSHVATGRWGQQTFRWADLPSAEEIDVPTATLPELLETVGFPRIDILKMDCEGMEGAILTHLKETGWLEKTHWIRGEWHGQEDVPVIETALSGTHGCLCRAASNDAHIGPFIAHNREDA